ncbi:MAG: hypothetical protein CL527_06555 [Aequorivita sp.]|nr:hypothetical protein [Aequorivita sp.]
MKKTIYIILFVIISAISSSCDQQKLSDLNNQILELKNQNEILKDSISKLELNNINAFYILPTVEESSLKVNEKATIDFVFGYRDYIKNYNVYRLTGEKENDRELILKDQKISEFKYSFTPKNKTDNRIKLMAVFNLDSISIEVPAEVTLNITE